MTLNPSSFTQTKHRKVFFLIVGTIFVVNTIGGGHKLFREYLNAVAEGETTGKHQHLIASASVNIRNFNNNVTTDTAAPAAPLPSQSPNVTPTGAVPTIPTIDYNYDFLHYTDANTRFPLPHWMDAFLKTQPVATHAQTLSDPNATFIVLACAHFKDGKRMEDCGGITDRLWQLPYLLWLAHKTGRKLLIKYKKPQPLEVFFVPPREGFDWRLPDGFLQDEWKTYTHRDEKEYKEGRRRVWHRVIETPDYASQKVIFVNNNLAIPSLACDEVGMDGLVGTNITDLWPGVFRRLFQPAPAVAAQMKNIVQQHKLQAGHYSAVHLRVRWPGLGGQIKYNNKWWKADKGGGGLDMSDPNTTRTVAALGDHAMDCAARLMPQARHVYLASDANEVVDYLMHASPQWANNHTNTLRVAKWEGPTNTSSPDPMIHGFDVPPWEVSMNATIVTRPGWRHEPLHFDGTFWKRPDDGYATFIDLWMMAHAMCHSHGVGGFGRWASILSGHRYECSARHRDYIGSVPSCATPAERKQFNVKHPGIQTSKTKKENQCPNLRRKKKKQEEADMAVAS